MNVYVFDVDGGGKSLERVVVKTVERGHEAQIFRDALREGLAESVVLNGQRNIVAQHFERIERIFFVESVAGAAAQGNRAGEFAADFERAEAFEEFGCHVSIRTQKNIVSGTVEHDGAGGGGQSVLMAGEERNHGGIGHEGESLSVDGGEQGATFVE